MLKSQSLLSFRLMSPICTKQEVKLVGLALPIFQAENCFAAKAYVIVWQLGSRALSIILLCAYYTCIN